LPEDEWFTTGDLFKIFQSHGWSKDPRGSKVLDKLCNWGYLEKQFAGRRPEYRVVLPPKEAERKGLLKKSEV